MNTIFKSSITLFLLSFQLLSAQEEMIKTIKEQAKKAATSAINGDYQTLFDHTHPNVIEALGGKDMMLKTVSAQMKELEKANAKLIELEIGDSIVISKISSGYHCLVPKIATMSFNNQTFMSKSYLFGFANSEGKHWDFVEADKLREKDGNIFFPNFETEIEIPKKGQLMLIGDFTIEENDYEITLEISWDKIKISKRNEFEKKIDKLLRDKKFGFCSGGENGKNMVSNVSVFITALKENQNLVFQLISETFKDENSEFDIIVLN